MEVDAARRDGPHASIEGSLMSLLDALLALSLCLAVVGGVALFLSRDTGADDHRR